MNAKKAIVTKPQLDKAYQAALSGYTKAYGQRHETPDGLYCWTGRIDRAYELMSQQADEMTLKRMKKAIDGLIAGYQGDMAAGEKAHADYVDLCNAIGIEPEIIDPACQCASCTRQPTVNGGFSL